MQNVVSSTDAYFNMLLHYSMDDPFNVLAAFFLMLARILPIMMLAPFLGAKNAPNTAKMIFSVAICAIFLPQVLIPLKEPLALDVKLIGYTIKELFVGFVLGFLVTIPFYVAQTSGSLIDHIRGSASLQVTDPTTQTQTGPVGIFYNYVLLVVFFAIGGPIYFIEGLSHSFELIPVNNYLNPYFFSLSIPFWKSILTLLTHVTSLAIQLGAPSIIGILMAEMFLGIANRMAPQVQIVFLGISLKSFVGLALLAAAWFFILNQFGKESMVWLKNLAQTIRYIAPLPH
jgi:type III secretory pathway component EscT